MVSQRLQNMTVEAVQHGSWSLVEVMPVLVSYSVWNRKSCCIIMGESESESSTGVGVPLPSDFSRADFSGRKFGH